MKKIDNHILLFIEKIHLCKGKHCLLHILGLTIFATSCSVSKQLGKQAQLLLLQDSTISKGHIGISIYEPATEKYWYNYNASQYFLPASNTKLFSLYAGLKYLGDSLVAARYVQVEDTIYIKPSGDPTFMHPDFAAQPLLQLLQGKEKNIAINYSGNIPALGAGWAWDDFDQDYVAERAMLPMYGNLVWISKQSLQTNGYNSSILKEALKPIGQQNLYIQPAYFSNKITFDTAAIYQRKKEENVFFIKDSSFNTIPFISNDGNTQVAILKQLLGKNVTIREPNLQPYQTLKSRPVHELFKPMMYNSDNFFAEQTLLMASNEHLGFMSTEAMVDTLLKLNFKDIPQRPTWVDGSGLSRYNLFTPQSFVYILLKMKDDVGLDKLKAILPTGGTGTLNSYYLADSSFIFAKTGTLTGTVALSGFLITQKNKLLIFSILTNSFKGRPTAVRKAIEKFISGIREKY